MTETSSAATDSLSTPQPIRTPRGFALALSGVNFGVFIALMTPVMVSMAFKIEHITASREEATSALGLVLGVGALFALFANPLAGRLSDRTTSRWGMRRPWILGGTIVGLGAFALIGVATSVWVVLIAWCLVQASYNAVLAAAQATLPDQVPENDRGRVGGIVGLMTPMAILAGSFLVNFLPGDFERFVVPAVIAVIASGLFVIYLKDRKLDHAPAERFTAKQFFGSFVFNPVKHRDFGWTWLTKFMIMFGYAGIATFLPFYLGDKFGLNEQETIAIILASNVAAMACMAVSSPLGGYLSDKIGKRRPFVAAAGMVMVIGLLILAFAPSVPVLIFGQAIIGLGAGCFFSVDLALATQVLPNRDDIAKDLGVLNIANALPQSIAPAMAPAVIAFGATTALGGYETWYVFGALVALAGSVLVYRIKGVK
ncbi:MFS transporter [Demequina flava]|uniref:MFS transporter n=1 Tax=Demequina flava TaxID=1095025 RepID=UPI000780E8B1|nr:MFS transporter [Demequina flava]